MPYSDSGLHYVCDDNRHRHLWCLVFPWMTRFHYIFPDLMIVFANPCRWLNFEDPLINRDPWTTSEDKNLLFTIQQKGLNNWIEIAVSSGTNRTPFQCLSRYQRSLNASILKREWTKDEDDKLRAAVATFGLGDWQAVASTLEGRTGPQCSNRLILFTISDQFIFAFHTSILSHSERKCS